MYKNTGSSNPKISKTKKGRIMLPSKCAVCDNKISMNKKQEATGLLSSLGLKIDLRIIPLLVDILKT